MSVYLGYRASDKLLEKLGRVNFEGVWRSDEHPRGEGPDWETIHLVGQALGMPSVDLVVGNPKARVKSKFASFRTWGEAFPAGAFMTDGSEVLAASPEFALALAAADLSDEQLMQMVMRYCGAYSPDAASEDGFVFREPMTTLAMIEALAAKIKKSVPGKRRLARALRWSAERSRSPMETNLMLALCLPKTSKGFGLPKPELNKRIELEGVAKDIAKKSYCYGDLVWGNYVLEYQGRRHDDTVGADLTRALALESMGYKVDFVAYEQFEDARQLDLVAKKAARGMGRWVDTSGWQDVDAVQELIDLLLRPS